MTERESLLSPTLRIVAVLFLITLAAYYNSFSSLYLFDDAGAVVDNPTIRHLWPLTGPLSPMTNGTPVTGRPVVNLTFAINYAVGGTAVGGYHVVNLLIHLLAGLALFGVVRRTLLLPSILVYLRESARLLAGCVAALWLVHPLQTESVSYVAQRAEALMSLFYLLTLYCFVRGATDNARWYRVAFLSCLAGMGSKEVMISAPLVIFLYDRTFLSGGFVQAWRLRWRVYLALMATWLLLAYEMIHVGDRGGSVGLEMPITGRQYALTQLYAIVHYLGLALWPHPLTFDYGTYLVTSPAVIAACALVVLALLALTSVALFRWPKLGFLGATFFALLAPTSSVIPLAKQTLAEHRMYLALATVLTLVVLGLHALLRRHTLAAVIVLSGVFTLLTIERNRDYLDGLVIWSDSLSRYPDNPRAHIDYGNALVGSGQFAAAIVEFQEASRLDPRLPEPHHNLAVMDVLTGHVPEAIEQYQELLRLNPNNAAAQQSINALQHHVDPASP